MPSIMAMKLLDHLRSTIRHLLRKGMAMCLNKETDSMLCETCKALGLVQMFREGVRESEAIPIGALATILSKKHTCDLCALISHLVSRSWYLDRHVGEDLTSVQVQMSVPPVSFDVPYNAYGHRIEVIASRPDAIERTLEQEKVIPAMALQMMENDAARFGRGRLYHGRKVGRKVDFKLVKEWVRICEKEHGPTCTNVWDNAIEQLPEGARMVDVYEMAIIKVPRNNCRYVALSYMWGNINTQYTTVMKNVSQRCHRGSLNRVVLPRTIGDAIRVVRKLGERYLWVDALCIIQDDPDNKMAQIAGMADIYGAAVVTIFAVGGDSADAPLPGLRSGSRQMQQHIKRIQSLSLAVPLRMLEETLGMSKWNTRGWTFQERMMSRRGLVFSHEQVYFRCHRDMFCEDVINEGSSDGSMYAGKHSGFETAELHTIRENKEHLEYRYQSYALAFMQILEDYTPRELTKSADIYNAFSAIMTLFSRYIEIPPLHPDSAFLFGMPESVLEDAMLWQPALNTRTHERRCEEGMVTPSWSWAGWKTSVVYFNLDGYGYSPVVALQSLVDEWVIIDSGRRARQIASGRHFSEDDEPPLEFYKYQKPSSPSSNASSLVDKAANFPPGTLLFYTTVASLWVRKVENIQLEEIAAEDFTSDVGIYKSTFHSAFDIYTSESSTAKMGKIVLPTDTDAMVSLEFVVLSRAEILRGHGSYDEEAFGIRYEGCLLNVMVIKPVETTVDDGKEVCERVGVGVIVETAWAASKFQARVVRLQ